VHKIDEEEKQIWDLYGAFGFAVYQAQCLERELAMMLVTAQAGSPNSFSTEQLESLYGTRFRQTLGQLIGLARKDAYIDKSLEDRLMDALSKRNLLAHNYFWERTEAIQTFEGRKEMISELRQIAHEFDELDNELMPITREWARSLGVTVAKVQELLKEQKRQSN
jgi:hypothetical protein